MPLRSFAKPPRNVSPAQKVDPQLAALIDRESRALLDRAYPSASDQGGFESFRGESVSGPAQGEAEMPRRGPKAFLRMRPASGFESTRGEEGGEEALVFITFRRVIAENKRLIEDHKIHVLSGAGRTVTARLLLNEVEKLRANDAVVYIELARPTRLARHVSSSEGGAPSDARFTLTNGDTTLPASIPLVGIVDAGGLDLYHPALMLSKAELLKTRVVALWDQTATPERDRKPPAPWNYGVEYTGHDINAELNERNDLRYSVVSHQAAKRSHGMHVTGAAAGMGFGEEDADGVVPTAEIIYVSTFAREDETLGSLTEIADAIDYIFARAGDRPCSVNLSLGDPLGPHDGSTPVERFIGDLLSVPGRSLTVAAGNSGNGKSHAKGIVAPKGRASASIDVDRECLDALVFQVWHDGQDAIDLEVFGPSKTLLCRVLPTDEGPLTYEIGGEKAIVSARTKHPLHDGSYFEVQIVAASAPIPLGTWRVVLASRSEREVSFHAWIDHAKIGWTAPDTSMTINSPATARRAIAVGAHRKGMARRSEMSSLGPTRDGRAKPDISAPSTHVVPIPSQTRRYATHTGTSIAAPLVAGSVALLFDYYASIGHPGLFAEDILFLLGRLADKEGIAEGETGLGAGRLCLGDVKRLPRAQHEPLWLRKHEGDDGSLPLPAPPAWTSPDIVVRRGERGEPDAVTVTVQSTGSAPEGARVALYWAPAATHIPLGSDEGSSGWRSAGVTFGSEERNWAAIEEATQSGASVAATFLLPLEASGPPVCLRASIEREGEHESPDAHELGRYDGTTAQRNVLPIASDATTELSFELSMPEASSALRIDQEHLSGAARVSLYLPVGSVWPSEEEQDAKATASEDLDEGQHFGISARRVIDNAVRVGLSDSKCRIELAFPAEIASGKARLVIEPTAGSSVSGWIDICQEREGIPIGGFRAATEGGTTMQTKRQGAVMKRTLEVDPGYYIIRQGSADVGRLFVEEVTTGTTEEHWVLYSGYNAPSESNSNTTLAFARDAELEKGDLFLELPSGVQYIVATCVVTALPS